MEKKIEMLTRYAEADMNKRLHFFLQFPDLRYTFQEIELRDLGEHNKGKHSRFLSLLSRIIEIKIDPPDLRWAFQEIELKELAAQRGQGEPRKSSFPGFYLLKRRKRGLFPE